MHNFCCIKIPQNLKEIIQIEFIIIIIDRFHIDCGEVLSCPLEALYTILVFWKKIESPVVINIIEKEIKDLEVFNVVKQLKKDNNEKYVNKTVALLNIYFRVANGI